MNGIMWTTLVAISAIGLARSPVASPPSLPEAPVRVAVGGPPDTLVASPRASSIRWRATGLGGRGTRAGMVGLASGVVVLRHEQLTSGAFVIDMRSLDPALRGATAFDAERYPTAEFRSSRAKRTGQATWQVSGALTMRGITKPLTFETSVRWEELGHMVATSAFTIDRRQWGIGTGDAGLAGAVADNDISISISLDARRKQAAVATR